MTVRLEDIFSEFKEIFIGRKEDIKKFLKKFEEKIFRGKKVLRVERLDSTEKIKLSGFRKNISSWLNPDGNPIISSCLIVGGVKRRYDYVFYLGKESSDISVIDTHDEEVKATIESDDKKEGLEKPEILDDIKAIYKDSFRLQHSFQFEQAIIQLDSMIDLLIDKNLPEYVKKLEEKRNHLKAAQAFYNKRQKELKEIDQRISRITQESKVIQTKAQFQDGISNINSMIDELKQKDFPEYLKKLERKKREIIEAEEIYDNMKQEMEEQKASFDQTYVDDEKIQLLKNLERSIKINKEFNQFEAAKINMEKLISILKELNRDDLIEKYSKELEEIKENFQYLEDNS